MVASARNTPNNLNLVTLNSRVKGLVVWNVGVDIIDYRRAPGRDYERCDAKRANSWELKKGDSQEKKISLG